MKVSTIYILFLAVILFSCQEIVSDGAGGEEETSTSELPIVEELAIHKQPLKKSTLDFELDEDLDISTIEDKLHGRFFNERAEFFVIHDPHKTILNAKVKKLTLFLLDGKLSKLKYELESNISEELINTFGSCRITGLDPESRHLLAHSAILFKENNKYKISNKLNNYQIQWDLGDKNLVMQVKSNEDENFYVYEEKIKNYERYFKSIEYNRN